MFAIVFSQMTKRPLAKLVKKQQPGGRTIESVRVGDKFYPCETHYMSIIAGPWLAWKEWCTYPYDKHPNNGP